MRRLLCLLAVTGLSALSLAPASAGGADPALTAAIQSPARTAKFAARDKYRHPAEELAFFGLTAKATVVEIWPGGGYWTEILAPYLRGKGQYIAAVPPAKPGATDPDDTQGAALKAKFAAGPARYSDAKIVEAGQNVPLAVPASSADFILTFRNLHNWMYDGYAPAMLTGFYKALKPGGILGVEEHRKRPAKPQDPKAGDGYVRQDYAIAMMKKAGFEYLGSSEIDANPKDTTEWPKGVWTLPPTLAMGETDRAKYLAIGEADNFVLKFRKPPRAQ